MRENLRYSCSFTSSGVEGSWEHSPGFKLRCDNVPEQDFSFAALSETLGEGTTACKPVVPKDSVRLAFGKRLW